MKSHLAEDVGVTFLPPEPEPSPQDVLAAILENVLDVADRATVGPDGLPDERMRGELAAYAKLAARTGGKLERFCQEGENKGKPGICPEEKPTTPGEGARAPAAPDPGDRPRRPAGGFRDPAHQQQHAQEMVKAHEADPHVQRLMQRQKAQQGQHDELDRAARAAPTHDEALRLRGQQAEAKRKLDQTNGDLAHESRRTFLLSFAVPPGEQGRIRADVRKGHAGDNWNKAEAFLSQLTAKGTESPYTVNIRATSGRAFYDAPNIRTSKSDDPSISAHEYGHHLETAAWIQERVKAFRASRFDPKEDVPMRNVAPQAGYGKEEVGNPDRMQDTFKGDANQAAYAGKTYGDGRTEIVSMGLEKLYSDPVHFAGADPEYFAFCTGILQKGPGA